MVLSLPQKRRSSKIDLPQLRQSVYISAAIEFQALKTKRLCLGRVLAAELPFPYRFVTFGREKQQCKTLPQHWTRPYALFL